MLRRCTLRVRLCLLALLLCGSVWRPAIASMAFIDGQIAAHPGETGVVVLDTGEAALRARAWLADHAQRSIEVQYFIWSSDNIGILATEALLRAAEHGVKVRVIVDDILINAPDKTLLALARHPNVDIRIYNPRHQVGTPFYKRALNVLTDFRGVNQRMHDKTFIVDGKVAITGGRNMADEYFDYDSEYTFRDRDALLVGDALQSLAFDILAAQPLAADARSQLEMVKLLAQAAGSRGMAGGQAIDLASVGKPLDLTELEFMHIHKTGALIRASVLLGAHCGTLPDATATALDHYAKCIGLAFQVVDDVLDAEASSATLGKTAGKDAANNKPTYVSLLGVARARELAQELRADAHATLENAGAAANRLHQLADFVVERTF